MAIGYSRSTTLALGLVAAAILLTRAAFLPPTLEDIDSVNFGLALAHFDPIRHQPHPPGYPLFVAAGKAVHAFVPDPARALGLTSALAQALLVWPLVVVLRHLASSIHVAHAAAVLTLANPILWFNGARPMSDSFGLLVVLSAQAALLLALSERGSLVLGSFLAGLTPGARLQGSAMTLPLWLLVLWRQPGRRAAALAAFAAGVMVWAVPLVVAAGGPRAYLHAFTNTMEQAAAWEPLLAGFTLNRALRALAATAIKPWGATPLGLTMMALASLGAGAMLVRRPATLMPGLLAFGPYLVGHLLFQHTETLRYSLPLVPFLAWLAAEGTAWLAGRLTERPRLVLGLVTAGFVAASAALVLPALDAYHRTPSPPFQALRAVASGARPREQFVLSGHHMFARYFDLRPEGLAMLDRAGPLHSVPDMGRYWRAGGEKPVLFLADPGRTDLAVIAPGSRRVLGRWEWPAAARAFLEGERPNRAELVSVEPPKWFAGEGWLLSLESGRVSDLPKHADRTAYLRAYAVPTFLLVAGEATGPAEGFDLELMLAGEPIARHRCADPLLAGYLQAPAASPEGYVTLTARTSRAGSAEGAPFALRGLDYGTASEPGLVRGDGWYYPEPDEEGRPFTWASGRARSLLHVPPGGATLRVEGTVPLETLGGDVGVQLVVDGTVQRSERLKDRRFRLEAAIGGSERRFHEVLLMSDRVFVPDRVQRNGDLRSLALRVYDFRLDPAGGARDQAAGQGDGALSAQTAVRRAQRPPAASPLLGRPPRDRWNRHISSRSSTSRQRILNRLHRPGRLDPVDEQAKLVFSGTPDAPVRGARRAGGGLAGRHADGPTRNGPITSKRPRAPGLGPPSRWATEPFRMRGDSPVVPE